MLLHYYSFFVFVSQTQKRIGDLMSSGRHLSILHYYYFFYEGFELKQELCPDPDAPELVGCCTCGSGAIEKDLLALDILSKWDYIYIKSR